MWLKALHLIFMVTWFAGLFYLPRLFVYHALADDTISRERFKVMERKLYWGITTPGMLLTLPRLLKYTKVRQSLAGTDFGSGEAIARETFLVLSPVDSGTVFFAALTGGGDTTAMHLAWGYVVMRVLPRDNEADLRDLPEDVRAELQFTLAERIEEALAVTVPSLAGRLQPVGV